MDLIIVDRDCKKDWSRTQLENLLDAKNDIIWFLDSTELEKNKYNAKTAASVEIGLSFDKALFITRFENGVNNYHKQMFSKTTRISRWIIVIIDILGNNYKIQLRNTVNGIMSPGQRYEIIFDDPRDMKQTLEAKQYDVDNRKICMVATKEDSKLAENVVKTLKIGFTDDWEFECHVGVEKDSYRNADIILVIGQHPEDFMVPPTNENINRVQIWIDLPRGRSWDENDYDIIDKMNEKGWNLGKRKIWSSCLTNEELLQELKAGKITKEELCSDDRFIMWDQYRLPLTANSYVSAEKADEFLRNQCCFIDILDNTNS